MSYIKIKKINKNNTEIGIPEKGYVYFGYDDDTVGVSGGTGGIWLIDDDGTVNYLINSNSFVPSIVSFEPSDSSFNGDTLTINGVNFISGTTSVTFSGQSSSNVQYISQHQISVVIPELITYGVVPVVVKTQQYGDSSPVNYTVHFQSSKPIITDYPPESPMSSVIDIYGTNFIINYNTKVYISSVQCNIIARINSTHIKVVVPIVNTGATSMYIETENGQSNIVAFIVTDVTNPIFTGFNPKFAYSGDIIGLSGYNFSAGQISVNFGAIAANDVKVISSNYMTAKISNNTPIGGTSIKVDSMILSGFCVCGTTTGLLPTITDISPTGATLSDNLVLTGTNLSGELTILFSGIRQTIISKNNSTSCNIAIDSETKSGINSVTITNQFGISDTYLYEIEHLSGGPVITSFSHQSANRNESIFIYGSGFQTGTGNVVYVGGIQCISNATSSTQLTVQLTNSTPTGLPVPTGNVDILVHNQNGNYIKPGFEVTSTLNLPQITNVSPNFGKVNDQISIYGTNLSGGTISFCDNYPGCRNETWTIDDTHLISTVPSGITAGDSHLLKIYVSTYSGTCMYTPFEVYSPSIYSPTITSITTSGRRGDLIEIVGTNFSKYYTDAYVSIISGNTIKYLILDSLLYISTTQLQGYVPNTYGYVGVSSIKVKNSVGSIEKSPFTILVTPTTTTTTNPMTTTTTTSGIGNSNIGVIYNFDNDIAANAAGTISLSVTQPYIDSYTLYFADELGEKLSNYDAITGVTLTQTGTTIVYQSFNSQNTLPYLAKGVVAIKSDNVTFGYYKISNSKKWSALSDSRIFSFGVLSDVHNQSSQSTQNLDDLRTGLTYFNSREGVIMTCITGDITQNGTSYEGGLFSGVTSECSPTTPVYVTTGNHDVTSGWSSTNTWWTSDTNCDKNYVIITGNTALIFLSLDQYSLGSTGTPYLNSDLTWLEMQLALYTNMRVFLFSHLFLHEYSGNFKERYPSGNWLLGPQYDRIKSILQSNHNIIAFNGHSHWMWHLQEYQSNSNIEKLESGSYLQHIPSCASPIDSYWNGSSWTRDDTSGYLKSEGAVVDVYDTYCVIRGRNLKDDLYLPIAQYIVPFNLPPTVVLHTSNAYNFGVDTTPTLRFTGTDMELDDISYNIQISRNQFSVNDFVSIENVVQDWRCITVNSNNDNIYAASNSGDIYKQTSGVGSFVALNQSAMSWYGISVDNINDDVYATVDGGDIYKQTSGVGNFIEQSVSIRAWRGIAVDSSNKNVYASVNDGYIYKQTSGVGSFDPISGTNNMLWSGIAVDSTNQNVYAVVYDGDIYKQTSGTGLFVSLGVGIKKWKDISVNIVTKDVYATVENGYVYKQTSGVGNFEIVSQNLNWHGISINSSNNDVYSTVDGIGIYKYTYTNIILSKFSSSDIGFEGITISSPYPSGGLMSYTVQPSDELSIGTYYWRTRGIDPYGSNVYGDWSITRTFIINTNSTTTTSINPYTTTTSTPA